MTDAISNALVIPNSYSWSSNSTDGKVHISYSFLTEVPAYYSENAGERTGFQAVTSEMQTGIRNALDFYEHVTNVKFDYSPSAVGQITFGQCTQASAAYTYWPQAGLTDTDAIQKHGDIWYNVAYSPNLTQTAGSYGYMTTLHEIGHALGLDHPGTYDSNGQLVSSKLPDASTDNARYTVMSYVNTTFPGEFPSTLQLYDIWTIQGLYGANTAYHSENNSYGFSNGASGSNGSSFSPQLQDVATVWDGGGIDTFDASNQTQNAYIDLHAGAFSSIGPTLQINYTDHQVIAPADRNIAIAYGVTIENAIGGAGNDTLIGNDANNNLTGGSGNDYLAGNNGNDTLAGGSGDDVLVGNAGDDWFYGGDGADVLAGDEGADVLMGNAGADYIMGGTGNDILAGDEGVDQLFGNDGADYMMGGADNDLLHGDGGADTLFGGTGSDWLYGDDGDDFLVGEEGNDGIDGGAGYDTAYFNGSRSNYSVYREYAGHGAVIDNAWWDGGDTGSDGLTNVERAQFNDGIVYFDGSQGWAPIVLDLDGDGVELTDIATSKVKFDMTGDGVADRTGWAAADDGLLVYDLHGDRKITEQGEVVLSVYGQKKGTDLEALAKAFDSNHDGRFDAKDKHWKDFGVWQDRNQNGVTDDGEFRTVGEAGLTGIALKGEDTATVLAGNVINALSSYTTVDGRSGTVGDVTLFAQSGAPNGKAADDHLLDGRGRDGLDHDTPPKGLPPLPAAPVMPTVPVGLPTPAAAPASTQGVPSNLLDGGDENHTTANAATLSEAMLTRDGTDAPALPNTTPSTITTPAAAPSIDAGRRLTVTAGGISRDVEMDAPSAPMSGIQNQYVGDDRSEAVRGTDRGDLINLRGGDDAVDGRAGDDVLDGGLGSNYLTGGSGNDTFFVDGRGGGTTWSTVTDLEKGELVTAWGWQPSVSKLTWAEMSGAEGAKGATAHIDIDGNGSIDMSITFAGNASGALIASLGQVNGSNYLGFTLS